MSNKESFEGLARKITETAQKITVGATYLHYKKLHPYKVLDIVISEFDQQPYVVYQSQRELGIKFTRSAASWLDEVEWQGKKTLRFIKSD